MPTLRIWYKVMPMEFPSLLIYLLSLGIFAAVVWQVQKLAHAFRLYFLSSHLGFLIAVGIFFILNLAVTDLSADVLRNIPLQSMEPVYILFGLVAFPLFASAYYFELVFVAGMLDEELAKPLRTAYFLIGGVCFALFLIRIQYALSGDVLPAALKLVNLGVGLLMGVIPLAIYAYFIIRAARCPRPEERSGLITFGAVSLAAYLLLLASMSLPHARFSLRWAGPVLLAVAVFSPFLVLKRFLSRSYRPIRPTAFEALGAEGFGEKFGLSKREGEILGLLLRGKSNREIEKDLFISPHTVRNHVHNIYQKLGVGSRLQLLNLVRERLE